MISFADRSTEELLNSNVQIVYNTNLSAKVLVESEQGQVYAVINKATSEVVLESIEKSSKAHSVYDVKIHHIDPENLDATLKESSQLITPSSKLNLRGFAKKLTGKSPQSFELQKKGDMVKCEKENDPRRFVWAIALVPEITAALYAVAATCVTFIAAGVTWYTAKAIKDLLRKNETYNYFGAMIDEDSNKVVAGAQAPATFQLGEADYEYFRSTYRKPFHNYIFHKSFTAHRSC